jgi:hypothetical protein
VKRLAVLAAVAACDGNSGLVSVSLTSAPGSHLLDDVQTLHVTNANPHEVHDVSRTSSGFDLALDFDATGEATSLAIDGLDASGTVIAAGASPQFFLGPLDGNINIYMAAPNSVAASPTVLDPPRSEVGVGTLTYGALLAGGKLSTGAPNDTLAIYNVFDHTIVQGLPLPAARAGVVVGIGANGIAYLFGGTDEAGAPTSNLYRFDTTIAPAGMYTDFGTKAGYERANELAIPIANEHFLLTGTPVGNLFGFGGSIATTPDITTLPAAGTSFLATDGVATAIFADANGVTRYHGGTFTTVDASAAARAGANVVALPDGTAVVVCGTPTSGAADAIRIDGATATIQAFPGVPSTTRTGCAAIATARHLIIAGGTLDSGAVATTAEIFDAHTLAPIATSPLAVPRTGAQAIALPNGQVLIAGGVDATGAPIATLELFTPANQ